MITGTTLRDGFGRFAQLGNSNGVMLVRITGLQDANQYDARPIEFDDNGQPQFVGEEIKTVINLAEPADATGQIPDNTDAIAIDVEGQWVVFVRPSESGVFPAKVINSQGSGVYSIREQTPTGTGTFADKQGATNIDAQNLAELSLGPGAAVDTGTIILATATPDNGSPPTVRYSFDHPAYAKYLD